MHTTYPQTGRSQRYPRWLRGALLVTWLAYSLAALAWWAYTEPGADVCVARATPQAEER